ncbi:MAG: transposase [Xanthomonadaceae bacterium]|nr:transposase [Xanthomonadaceae bacterium]
MESHPTPCPPGHRALRGGRFSTPGQAYLVTTTTRLRRPWFADWDCARTACATLHHEAQFAGVTLLAWVLMPDHWHALLSLDGSRTLSQAVNRLKSTSAIAVNAAVGRRGPVWARAFHDRALRADEDALATARYIVANPVRAGLCAHVGEYPFWNTRWIDADPASLHP